MKPKERENEGERNAGILWEGEEQEGKKVRIGKKAGKDKQEDRLRSADADVGKEALDGREERPEVWD